RCWLVDDTHHFESRDFARVFGRLALRIVEVGGDRDYGFIDLLTEIVFGRLLHLLQDDRGDLRWAPILAPRSDSHVAIAGALNLVGNLFDFFRYFVIATSHKSLNRVDSILGIGDCLALCNLPDESTAVFGKGYDRRCGSSAFRVGDNGWFATFHNGHN